MVTDGSGVNGLTNLIADRGKRGRDRGGGGGGEGIVVQLVEYLIQRS